MKNALMFVVLILITMMLPACATTVAGPPPCSDLVPKGWKAGVAPTPPPPPNPSVGDLYIALDGQTGKLDQANGRTRDSIEIVENCEARDRAAIRKSKSLWSRLFG